VGYLPRPPRAALAEALTPTRRHAPGERREMETKTQEPMVEHVDGAWWIVEHRPGVEVHLPSLTPNQRVTWGDGETYHRLLTRTDAKSESEAVTLALARATPTESEV
jgi:hypothetical protein